VRNRLRTGTCPLAPDRAGTRPYAARENGDRGGGVRKSMYVAGSEQVVRRDAIANGSGTARGDAGGGEDGERGNGGGTSGARTTDRKRSCC
jgi:hypothetical protein